jgi:ABC-type multidrug transport system ATPase subunit
MTDAGTTEPLLRVEHISKRFGITQALDEVSVSFAAGEVHALMGENGAGKSTLGKVIAGLVKQDAGEVLIGGRRLTPGALEEAFAAGVRIVHQELAQCPNLTVAENLCLHDLPRTRIGTVDRREMTRRARTLLTRIEPGIDPRAPLGSLSPGHRQIVQIAAALEERGAAAVKAVVTAAGSGPRRRLHTEPTRVIVFDEPTSSLSIAETGRLLKIVRQLASEGLCIIYVSHRMGEIFECCDRVTVLRDGKYIATTPIKGLDEPALVEQMIGRRLEAPVPRAGAAAKVGGGEAAALRSLAADSGAHHVDRGGAAARRPADRIAGEAERDHAGDPAGRGAGRRGAGGFGALGAPGCDLRPGSRRNGTGAGRGTPHPARLAAERDAGRDRVCAGGPAAAGALFSARREREHPGAGGVAAGAPGIPGPGEGAGADGPQDARLPGQGGVALSAAGVALGRQPAETAHRSVDERRGQGPAAG